MDKSRKIAALLGPTIVVMISAEMKWWNPSLYDTQITPLIYLNGILLFAAGVAILINHHVWIRAWQSLITMLGYLITGLGLFRVYFPEVQKNNFENGSSIMVMEIILILIGLFLCYKAWK